jgi:hypothetical protein
LAHVGGGPGIVEIRLIERKGAFEEVIVAIREAGKHNLSRRIDGLRSGSSIFCNFFVAANRDNFVTRDRECFGPTLLRIHGVDPAVKNDKIGSRGAYRTKISQGGGPTDGQ